MADAGGALVVGGPVTFAEDVTALVSPDTEALNDVNGPPSTEKAGAEVEAVPAGGPGGTTTGAEELPVLADSNVDELVGSVRVADKVLDSGIGNGDRGESAIEPSEFELVEAFKPRFGVALGSIADEALSEETMKPVLARPSDDELDIGKPVRGKSEIEPSELEVEDTLKLAVGVGIDVLGFENTTSLVVLFDSEELRIRNGVRGRSEIEPSELKVVYTLRLDDSVELGIGNGIRGRSEMDPSEVDETFIPGTGNELGTGNGVRGRSEIEPREVDEMFKTGVEVELGMGNGVRGRSDMDPNEVEFAYVWESVELVVTGIEELNDGAIMPLLPVAEVIAVLHCIVNALLPPDDKIIIVGVGARLTKLLSDAFAEDGGIMPEAAVENTVAVDPEVEKIPLVRRIIRALLEERLAGTVLDKLLEGGGMMPEAPAEEVTAVDPDIEETSRPDDAVRFGPMPGVDVELATPGADGGMIPDAPAENVVAVLPELVS